MPKKYQPRIKFQVVLESFETDKSTAQNVQRVTNWNHDRLDETQGSWTPMEFIREEK